MGTGQLKSIELQKPQRKTTEKIEKKNELALSQEHKAGTFKKAKVTALLMNVKEKGYFRYKFFFLRFWSNKFAKKFWFSNENCFSRNTTKQPT